MSYIETYKNINEIKEIFELEIITTEDVLLNKITDLSSKKNMLFRGVNNGSYKMYSSSQRYYLTDFLYSGYRYEDFLTDIEKYCSKIHNGLFVEKYNNQTSLIYHDNEYPLHFNDNALWKFVMLQHLVEVSPLIDFSSDLNVALFFALYKANDISSWYDVNNNPVLSDYIQINYFDNNNLMSLSCNIYNNLCNPGINENNKRELFTTYKKASDIIYQHFSSPTYIPYGNEISEITTSCRQRVFKMDLSNPNIISQSGILFINNNDDFLPFENYWKQVPHLPQLNKLLIHKSLLSCIKHYFEDNLNIKDLKSKYYSLDIDLKTELFSIIKEKRNFK